MIRQIALRGITHGLWHDDSIPFVLFLAEHFRAPFFRDLLVRRAQRNVFNFRIGGLLAIFPSPNP
ncbi:MAG: hypothetical protein PHY43_10205 [Verrucomicrobiales bacterium]|nr:hypothetical protein [Verrucomicrobiales bacterium]